MSRIAALFLHLVLVLAGFFLAALAASGVLHLVFLAASGFKIGETPFVVLDSLWFSVPFTALIVASYVLFPAALFIVLAEALGWRGWHLHMLGGAIIGFACEFLLMWRSGGPPEPDLFAMLAAAGAVGGLAYWAVAGRSSGLWRNAGSGSLTSPERR